MQALYQMDVAGSGVLEIAAEYEAFRLGKEVDGAQYREADAQWFRAILSGVVENQKIVDPVIRQALTEDWPLSRLDSTLRAILRAGVYEIMKRDDVPVAVIVSEYVDIAKAFYAEDEPKLVNAVLDRVSRQLRGEGRGKDAFVSRTPAEREARRTAIILSASQAIVGSAAVVAISLGALAGQYLLGADKSLATAPITGFNLGVALGACRPPRSSARSASATASSPAGWSPRRAAPSPPPAFRAEFLAVCVRPAGDRASAAPSCSNTASPPPTTRRPNSRRAPSPSCWPAASSRRSSDRRSSSSRANCWRR